MAFAVALQWHKKMKLSLTTPGINAMAYDNILDDDHISQLPTENGAWGDPGTPYHPDTL